MNWRTEWKKLALVVAVFLICYYLPIGELRFDRAVLEGFYLVKSYAQDHVLLCLIPAFFIAGAIGVFVSQASIMKYLGAGAHKAVAYGVASVSGSVLAVCSCTVLPLFSGIYRMGAGLGPAVAFLYSGPAINVLAVVLTAHVLGMELGIARAVGAIAFSIIIGLAMHFIYRKEEAQKVANQAEITEELSSRTWWQSLLYFVSMIGILVFANWQAPEESTGIWATVYESKWFITSAFAAAFGVMLTLWFKMKLWKVLATAVPVMVFAMMYPETPLLAFIVGVVGLSVFSSMDKGETGVWFASSWSFAKQILPLLLFGVFIAGVLLGRVGHEGLIPSDWVASSVGGNSFGANLFAAIAGAFMYFATLTEIPILQALIGSGMGKGPALSLLLAGPALSLPNMLVIRSVMGTQKTLVYISLVALMATISGMIYGNFFG